MLTHRVLHKAAGGYTSRQRLLSLGLVTETDICGRVRERIRQAGIWRVPGSSQEGERAHLISPEPFELPRALVDELENLGSALLSFYKAVNSLYLRDGPDWARDYLDIGKPEELLRHARMNYQKHALPGIIRPDIILTDDGPVITELDSVPGGFGHLDCLSAAYENAGFDLIGSERGVSEGFAEMIRRASGRNQPVCAIVVSDESVDYLPEMEYLSRELRASGLEAYAVRPKELQFTEEGLFIDPEGEGLRIDVLHRFFELFDLLNIPKSELISYAARKRLVTVTPPYKHFLEEKLMMALLHSRLLDDYWHKAIGEEDYSRLKRTVSETAILDNRPVPPHAEISGFRWKGRPLRDWRDLESGTQKERRLVIKPSGFSPLAWGSRGVKIGHDMSQEEWANAVGQAIASFDTSPWVIQPFREGAIHRVKYHDESAGEIKEMDARVRLCPYYFVIGDEARLGGVLATACSKEKKLIHGMSDAVMMPCRIAG